MAIFGRFTWPPIVPTPGCNCCGPGLFLTDEYELFELEGGSIVT